MVQNYMSNSAKHLDRSTMSDFESRRLSIHERYSLVQDNLSQPSLITYLACFSAKSSKLPSAHALQFSLDGFVQKHALLRARVEGWDTVKPNLCPLVIGALRRPCELVLSKDMHTDYAMETSSIESGQSAKHLAHQLQMILKSETENARQSMNIETGDMFRVIRVTHRGSEEEEGVVVLVVHHIITDGMGGLGFFSQLLRRAISPEDFPMVDPERPSQLPPALESTIDLKPSALTIASKVWSELVLPKLPTFLRTRLADSTSKLIWPEWTNATNPNEPNTLDHSTLPCNHSVVLLPSELIQRLQTLISAHHPPQGTPRIKLTSILVAALYKAIRSSIEPSVEVVLESNVPLSERDQTKGHPDALGNYMVPGTFRWKFGPGNHEGLEGEQAVVWEVAESLARGLENGLRTGGRETWGMTAYIPDADEIKDIQSTSKPTNSRCRGAFTGWEEFFGNPEERTKYSSSLQVSNLGRLPPSFPLVDAVVWGHPAACFGAQAIEVDCVGMSSGDVWLCFNWREGGKMNTERVHGIIESLKGILGRLADGQV